MNVLIANSNPILNNVIDRLKGNNVSMINKKEQLNENFLNQFSPNYIFFLHWSYLIPEDIFNNYTCIVFHMTDLPYGRGGSPLQNLIERGHINTKISAIKVVKEIDAGPIYLKRDLALYGTAEEIFLRASKIIAKMAQEIINNDLKPVSQEGEPVFFKRRKPEMGNLHQIDMIEKIYDYIRMLDAEGYPKAFIENEYFRFEFSRASLKSNESIIADVRIFKK